MDVDRTICADRRKDARDIYSPVRRGAVSVYGAGLGKGANALVASEAVVLPDVVRNGAFLLHLAR